MSFCASCSGAIQEFIRSSFCGIEKILAAYNRWWGNRNLASAFMVISYEQMSKDLGLLLRDSLRFMGNWPIDEIPISESVLAASFKNMRDIESEGLIQHHSLKRPSLDPRARKIREGKVGGFRNHLDNQVIAYIERSIERIGDPFANYYKCK